MPDLRSVGVVAIGAAIGGTLRFVVGDMMVMRYGAASAPLATVLINVSGSFCIGMMIELARTKAGLAPLWRPFVATGILGGYTTFSTFSFEALGFFSRGLPVLALMYIAASVVFGLLAAYAGVWAVDRL